MNQDLTAQEVRDRLSYDPETGVFIWLKTTHKASAVGTPAGRTSDQGYREIVFGSKKYKAHRLAWLMVYGEWPDGQIDHINGVRNDNRICNLRVVASAVNTQNQRSVPKHNTTGFLGVHFSKKTGKWRASIKVSMKQVHIGCFDTPEAAHQAYVEKKRELHPGCTI